MSYPYYRRNGKNPYHYHREDYVGSDYDFKKKNPITFKDEEKFYYVNFLDDNGEYNSEHSVMVEGYRHAVNLVNWYVNHRGALSRIPYYVRRIGVYDSHRGNIWSKAV
jgi:hypothetical protein